MIQQLMFGGGAFSFDAVTGAGQFNYVEYPSGNNVTQNYTASEMTTWFNDGSVSLNSVLQSQSGTLTVNFNFTVPAGFSLYLAARMGDQMDNSTSQVSLNGSVIKSGWTNGHLNTFVATAGTSISSMAFSASVGSSGFNDGYVVRVENFILVPTGTSVSTSYDGADILANVSGAIATGV